MNGEKFFQGILIFGIPIGLSVSLVVVGIVLARKSRHAARMREIAVHVQLALEDFHRRNGVYPDTLTGLTALHANRLAEWISPADMADLTYSSNGRSYLLQWSAPRFGFVRTNMKIEEQADT